MYCGKCGKACPDSALYCPKCGNVLTGGGSSGGNTRSKSGGTVKCDCCGARMEFDPEKLSYVCPYCGNEQQDYTAARLHLQKAQQQKAKTEKQPAQPSQPASVKVENRRVSAEGLKQARIARFKKEKMRFFARLVEVFAALLLLGSRYTSTKAGCAVVLVIQIVLLELYFLLGKQIIPEKREGQHRFFGKLGLWMILAFILVIQ